MKIIQSFWSGNRTKEEVLENFGNFLIENIQWMSWAYSCLQLKKYYGEVELYTDKVGKEILIDWLQLPYTKVHIVFDKSSDIKSLPSNMWSLAKLYIYSLQEEPFIHFDGDVFISERIKEDVLKQDIIVQNIENNFSYNFKIIDKYFSYSFKGDIISNNNISICAGIIGGTRIDLFKEYKCFIFEWVFRNKEKVEDLFHNIPDAVALVEQVGFYHFLVTKGIFPTPLFKIDKEIEIEQFGDIVNFPNKVKFLHFMGMYKKNILINLFILHSLQNENYSLYNKISGNIDIKNKHRLYLNYKPYNLSNLLANYYKINNDSIMSSKFNKLKDIYQIETTINRYLNKHIHVKANDKNNIVPFPLSNATWSSFYDNNKHMILLIKDYQLLETKFNWQDKIWTQNIFTNKAKIKDEIRNIYMHRAKTLIYLHPVFNIPINIQFDDYDIKLFEFIYKREKTNFHEISTYFKLHNISEEIYLSKLKKWFQYRIIDIIDSENNLVVGINQFDLKYNFVACITFLSKYAKKWNLDFFYWKKLFETHIESGEDLMLETIITVLKKNKINVEALKAEKQENIFEIEYPIITLIILREYIQMYVVITKITKEVVEIMNPEYGEYETYPLQYFYSMWTGIVLQINYNNEK